MACSLTPMACQMICSPCSFPRSAPSSSTPGASCWIAFPPQSIGPVCSGSCTRPMRGQWFASGRPPVRQWSKSATMFARVGWDVFSGRQSNRSTSRQEASSASAQTPRPAESPLCGGSLVPAPAMEPARWRAVRQVVPTESASACRRVGAAKWAEEVQTRCSWHRVKTRNGSAATWLEGYAHHSSNLASDFCKALVSPRDRDEGAHTWLERRCWCAIPSQGATASRRAYADTAAGPRKEAGDRPGKRK